MHPPPQLFDVFGIEDLLHPAKLVVGQPLQRFCQCPATDAQGKCGFVHRQRRDDLGLGDARAGGHAARPIRIAGPWPRWSNRYQAQLSFPVILLSGIHFSRPTDTTLRSQGKKGADCRV